MIRESADLPVSPPVFLPTWLPGETLYSLCARYHRLSANRLAADTSLQLFAARDAGFWHDFPSHLGNFVKRTQGMLGSVEVVAHRHTMLGFYAHFRTGEEIAAAISAMTGLSVRDLKFRLGLPASRIGASHPLKACSACMEEDRRTEGVAYWHLEHQWPSTWLCRRHDQLLQVCLARNKTMNHLQWILPGDIAPALWWRPPLIESAALQFLARLARMTADLQDQPAIKLKSERFRKACLIAAHRRGWLRESGSARLADIRKAFLAETAGINAFPGMEFMSDVVREDGGFVGLLLRHVRGNKHPVKHLLLTCFLFGDWKDFVNVYASDPEPCMAADPRRTALAVMIQKEGLRISEAARRLDLPIAKAIYWAKKDGIQYQRRPRLVDKAMALLISEALRNGEGCNEVAGRIGLPVSTVRRFLDTHDEVRQLWSEMRRALKKTLEHCS